MNEPQRIETATDKRVSTPASAALAPGLVQQTVHAMLQAQRSSAELPAVFRQLADLNRHLHQLQSEGYSAEPMTGITEALLSDRSPAQMHWSAINAEASRMAAYDGLVSIPHLKPVENGMTALGISVANGERTQLRFDFSGDQASVFCHFLFKATFEGVPEAFAAIRWLHGSGNEEVMVRLRTASIVIGQAIEKSVSPANHANLLSLGRSNGRDIILLNGVPVYWRPAETTMPTGITLDIIGAAQGLTTFELPLFVVNEAPHPAWCTPSLAATLLDGMLADCADTDMLDEASHWLYGLAGLEEGAITSETARKLVLSNLNAAQAYRDHITRQALAGLPSDDRQALLQTIATLAPRPAAIVENVQVRISSNPSMSATLQQTFSRKDDLIPLLDGINFDAFMGDIIGIIGKNGAGKTTFLKTLVASMPLSTGRICVDGQPILLRPGAGMQGDLTGRENVLKTGLYMGFLPHEMEKLMDDIISFSELEDHIDRPFRYYSDGMRARLIFALATAVPRDILLLDELLSAGDMGFQKKAMKRLHDFIEKAKLVFVVQHTFDFVLSRCTKCLLLENGRQVYYGDPRIATEMYREML